MFKIRQSGISGCLELEPHIFEDLRGSFVKIFHEQAFAEKGLHSAYAEEYYSVSKRNVIRGLHFQLPPMDAVKMVYCVAGEVLDAVVDLRLGSPTYGQHELFELSATKANSVYIPKGMAHGFCVLSDMAIMVYKVSSVYSAVHDAGVRWDSAGIPWPKTEAIVSSRDEGFLPLDKFESPFTFA